MEKVVHKYHSFKEADKVFLQNASIEFKFKALDVIRYNYYHLIGKDIQRIEKVVKIRKLHEEEQD